MVTEAMATTEPPTKLASGKAVLYRKLAAVLGEVSRVPKNGENTYFHYRYVTESDLVDVLRPALAKHGVALIVQVEGIETRPGGPQGDITRVQLSLTFACGETGETISTTWYGEGQDKADKGLAKSYTAAVKYALMKTFLVSSGDDPEDEQLGATQARPERPAQQPASGVRPAQPPPKPAESAEGGSASGRPPANGQAQAPAASAPVKYVSLKIGDKEYQVPEAFEKIEERDRGDYAHWVEKLWAAKTLEVLDATGRELAQQQAVIVELVFAELVRVGRARRKKLSEPTKEGANG